VRVVTVDGFKNLPVRGGDRGFARAVNEVVKLLGQREETGIVGVDHGPLDVETELA
jgi:hypothetical protein